MKITKKQLGRVVKNMINEQYIAGFGSGFGDLYSHKNTPVLEEGIDGIKIGEISANIGDDYRFNQWMKVFYNPDDSVTIQLTETGAVGGSDGPGTATGRSVTGQAHLPPGVKAGKVASTVRNMIASNGDTIARYGKPSREFNWRSRRQRSVGKGISVRVVRLALEAVRAGD
jgi:hypothetical protein